MRRRNSITSSINVSRFIFAIISPFGVVRTARQAPLAAEGWAACGAGYETLVQEGPVMRRFREMTTAQIYLRTGRWHSSERPPRQLQSYSLGTLYRICRPAKYGALHLRW